MLDLEEAISKMSVIHVAGTKGKVQSEFFFNHKLKLICVF